MSEQESKEVQILHRRKDDKNGGHVHKRQRVLTEEDRMFLTELMKEKPHHCRFDHINTEDFEKAIHTYKQFEKIDPVRFEAAINFFEEWTKILTDSKSVVRRTLIVIIVTAIAGLTVAGFWAEAIKKMIGKN